VFGAWPERISSAGRVTGRAVSRCRAAAPRARWNWLCSVAQLLQPIPSLFASKRCGSSPITAKSRCGMSPQIWSSPLREVRVVCEIHATAEAA
jgi:hypothetical protein